MEIIICLYGLLVGVAAVKTIVKPENKPCISVISKEVLPDGRVFITVQSK